MKIAPYTGAVSKPEYMAYIWISLIANELKFQISNKHNQKILDKNFTYIPFFHFSGLIIFRHRPYLSASDGFHDRTSGWVDKNHEDISVGYKNIHARAYISRWSSWYNISCVLEDTDVHEV